MRPEDVHVIRGASMGQETQTVLTAHVGFDFTKRIVRPDGKIRSLRCVGVPRSHERLF